MINSATNLSHPTEGEPKHKFTSKISSPTKRTLNNKNYLAEDAPAYHFKPNLEEELNDKLKISSLEVPAEFKKDENLEPLPQRQQGFPNRNYKNILETNGMPLRHGYPYQPRHDTISSAPDYRTRLSPTKNSKATNSKSRNPRCKEKNDASQVPTLNKLEKDKIIASRYFSPPIDLRKMKRADGKLRPIIYVTSSGSKNLTNSKIYRLTVPLMTCDESHQVVRDEIENNRHRYRQTQPLHHNQAPADDFGETVPNLRNTKKTATLRGPLLAGSSLNDSFDLSFDGKALDRSDIFRMVDSFSVAQSDDEPEEDNNNSSNLHSKNVLPAEMTSSAF